MWINEWQQEVNTLLSFLRLKQALTTVMILTSYEKQNQNWTRLQKLVTDTNGKTELERDFLTEQRQNLK